MEKLMSVNPWCGFRTLLLVITILSTSPSWALPSTQCPQVCDWFSTLFPLCTEQDSSWGFENNQSCVGRLACEAPWNTGGVIEQCDSSDDTALCAAMVGREYYSDALFSLGLGPDLTYYGHRQVVFEEGSFWATETDIVFDGPYRCENGQVLATIFGSEQPLAFANDFQQLEFPNSSNTTLNRFTLSTEDGPGCGPLVDARYEVDPSHLAALTLPAGTSYAVEFGAQNSAQMQLPEGDFNTVYYDCSTGALHLHRNVNDDSPIIGTIEDDHSAIVLALDANTSWRFLRDDGQMCTTQYDPVCSVEFQDIVCVTEPCPIGEYKTYSNRCFSDAAGALFIKAGECGALEGEPYFESACTAEYDPVCTAMVNPQPCLDAPCPIQEYKTFDNRCISRLADARYLHSGECGNKEGQRVFDLTSEGGVCGAIYLPVCAKEESGIVCVTEPCPTHEYMTFGNSCEASIAVADITWSTQTCGDLEGVATTAEPPVKMVESVIATAIQVTSAAIRDDVLQVSLRYTGCDPLHFDLQIEQAFSENNEANWAFTPVVEPDQSCLAYQEVDLRYDLLPLQVFFEASHGEGPATIVLPGLIDYDINKDAVQQPSLTVNHPETGTVGASITVEIAGQFYGETAPGYPSLFIQNPNGTPITTTYDHNYSGGPPWQYNMIEYFRPEMAGDYTVTVSWSAADIQQTSTITVASDETGGCASQGVDMSSVNAYPNFPNLDWQGQPYNANYGDLMSYQGDVFRALWWTTSVPGSDVSWQYVCSI